LSRDCRRELQAPSRLKRVGFHVSGPAPWLSARRIHCTNVHRMKRYTASQLRAHLSEALDEVERGGEVTVDRGKHTFRIVAATTAAATKTKRRMLRVDLIDERLLGGWTWEPQEPGQPMRLRLRRGSRNRRRRS